MFKKTVEEFSDLMHKSDNTKAFEWKLILDLNLGGKKLRRETKNSREIKER